MSIMVDLPSAIAQEAQEYVAVRGTTLERMFLDYLKAVRRENAAGRRGNAAVNSQNEAVRIQFEAVNFRNEAVKRTSAPCPTEKRSMKKTKRSMTVRTNTADRFFMVSVEMP